FPSAYHIKVIVRDNNAVWLSSGNLNRSNEPNLSNPPSAEDRDWHVIIEDPKLAAIFTAFLNFDFHTATANQPPNQQMAQNATVRAIVDAHAKRARETNPPPPPPALMAAATSKTKGTSVAAKTFNNLSLKVTPMLTPDRQPGSTQGQYFANVMALINGA